MEMAIVEVLYIFSYIVYRNEQEKKNLEKLKNK